jgi:hypothetical protein
MGGTLDHHILVGSLGFRHGVKDKDVDIQRRTRHRPGERPA